MREIVVILHDIRSTLNVGSLFRTAEGLGIKHIYCTGYTPYPALLGDDRLPHIREKLNNQIHKTALGAEQLISWSHERDITSLLKTLQADGYQVIGLEQDDQSVPLPTLKASKKCAVLLGREVEGIESELLEVCDTIVEIPMYGQKESFNVVQAAAIMLYSLRES